MTARNSSLKALLIIVALLIGGLAVIGTKGQKADVARPQAARSIFQPPKLADLPFVPTPTPQIVDVHSGDGKMKLAMRVERHSPPVFSLYTSEINGDNQKLIFTKTNTASVTGELSIPPNAWSPDNKYVFVQETGGDTGVNYFVFKANGEPFANGEQYLNIAKTWQERKIGYLMRDATGWASPSLVIVRTSKEDGSRGHSYWFEVPSKAILQLRD